LTSNHAETARLSALSKCRILDTGPERAFDELARLAAHASGCPLALIAFVDRDRIWLKSAFGCAARELPRAHAPFELALAGPLALVDAAADARFRQHPLVAAEPRARFVAAAPIHSHDRLPIGALVVLDRVPRSANDETMAALCTLASAVSAQVELRLLRDARLLKSEALLSSAQRIAGFGCWEWDMQTHEITWSEAMYAIFDRPRDHMPTLDSFMERVHPDDRAGLQERVQQSIDHGLSRYPDYRIVWSDGSVRVLAATAELERDQNGVPLRLTGAIQDVTEQRKHEVERQQMALQMLHAQKLESLGVLAAGVAHDFNNLLVGVLGNAELAALDGGLSSGTRHLLDQVIEAATRAAGLTRQLLAYTGRGHFSMRNVDLAGHVAGLSALLRASLPRSVQLSAELGGELPEVRADLDQLQQVTMNLILNAAEAYEGSEGEVQVRAFALCVEGAPSHALSAPGPLMPGRYVVLEVSDRGCGMEPHTLQRIFEPFFSTKFTGRGLGLAAVLGIVRGHEAVLTVDSAAGAGTTFRVHFPVAQQREAAPAPLPALGPAPAPELDPLKGSGVLVVDDEERVRAVARAVIASAGARVLEACHGAEALALFESRGGEIDAVLLDVVMPGMDVASVLRGLRARRPELPVLIYSGYPEEEATRQLRELDTRHSAFLEKPFTPATLLAKLRSLLGLRAR
jgi:two-component system, cell cycle sensor histidine kinase and response regulator CckA